MRLPRLTTSAAKPPPSLDASDLAPAVPPLRPGIEIPVCAPSPDAQDLQRLRERGRHLARQEAWDNLAAEMRDAGSNNSLTAGLYPVAMCLAEGARSDVCHAIRHAQETGGRDRVTVVSQAFAANLADEDPEDQPMLSYLLAMVELETAHLWRGASPVAELAPQLRSAYMQHMRAAQALADQFDPFEHQSMLWAALRCAILDADAAPATRMADDYEDLIELDPHAPLHLKRLGVDAAPRRFGSWEVLETQARRAAQQTRDVWGMGGYSWVYIGALERDSGAFRRLDAELFCEGLHDILERCPTQDMANRLAAFTGLTVGGPTAPGTPRRRIADALGWITQDHLRELHPEIWAEAPSAVRFQSTDTDPIKRGRMRANSTLAEFYAPALQAGRRLVFGPDGLRMLKGD
ncbi:hypothetical protein [Sagittula sp. SSi028]|uniref:hypothetical protein n=1 Tax=Sagittula sp. SSi028 TaxID=3400636 RepID=UPI003AF58E16